MTNIPNIRFKGFTDDWEQRKYGDVIDLLSGQDFLTDAFNDLGEGVPYMTGASCIEGNQTIVNRWTMNPKCIANKGDVLVVCKGSGCGTIAILAQPEAHIARQFMALKCCKNLDSLFNFYLANSVVNDIKKDARGLITGIARDAVLKIDINVPSMSEQKQIGAYLSSFDHIINLHQRKCDETKELKKYMLQKMFPQNGKQIPEIRFAGFTDDWEQRKLRNIADKVTIKNAGIQYVETLTNSAEFGIISQRDFFDHDVSNMENIDGYYVVENDAFVYNPRISTLAPVGPINRNKLGRTGVMSPLYTVFKTHDIDSEYLEWFFKSSYWYSFMYFNGDTGARSDRFSIKDAVFFEMPIPVPDIGEQRKIGKYLTQLDSIVTLHQRKCDELKEVKKFMLQNMFPQKG